MSFSLTSAGSPDVPRLAESWVRTTALGALDACVDEVVDARARAADQFSGASGLAYAAHTGQMLLHLQTLRARFVRAADLFGSYADRLVAHETLLAGVRSRALAAGLVVLGDQVLPPDDAMDLVAGTTWSDLAGLVADEQRDLLAWVTAHLEGSVESFTDESLVRWVLDFLQTHHATLLTGTAGTRLRVLAARRLAEAEELLRGLDLVDDPFDFDVDNRLRVEGEVDELIDGAGQLDRLGRVLGPVGITYDTVMALESDEPASGLIPVLAGTAAGAAVPILLTGPVGLVGATTVLATIGGAALADTMWQRLPEPMQESADEIVGDVVDGARDLVSAGFDEVRSWG